MSTEHLLGIEMEDLGDKMVESGMLLKKDLSTSPAAAAAAAAGEKVAEEEEPLIIGSDSSPAVKELDHSPVRVGAQRGNCNMVVLLTVVSALGGFLFGYDTGVVSGAVIKIRETFLLTSTWVEIFVSVTIAAAAISALIAGFLCDLFGRKRTLILASVVFTVGSFVLGLSYNLAMLVIGRAVVGVGIGMAAMAVPMYIAESAPAKMRGTLVVVNSLFLTGGQFVATVVDGIFSYLRYDLGWRFMLGLAAVPSVLMFIGMLFMPESPRWLVLRGWPEHARMVLTKLRREKDVDSELQSIVKDFKQDERSKLGCFQLAVKFCTTRTVLMALMIGCGLQLFQQFLGINTVMYYSASIIKMAGFPDQSAIWLATIPGGSNFIFTIAGFLLVDKLGRRNLLVWSSIGVMLSFGFLFATFINIARFSPESRPYEDPTHKGAPLCAYSSCGQCVGNSECGFCADFDHVSAEYYNGTCVPLVQSRNGSFFSKYRPVMAETGIGMCAVFSENAIIIDDPSLLEHQLTVTLSTAKGGNDNMPNSTGNDTIINSTDSKPSTASFQMTTEEGFRNDSKSHYFERKWYPYTCPGNRIAPLAVVALFLYIVSFAPGWGLVPWTVNSEIYPTWARSTAISIATTTNWACNLVVSMTFLTMADSLGQPMTFGLYGIMGFVSLFFVVLFLPETKGVRLEEMSALFKMPYFLSKWAG